MDRTAQHLNLRRQTSHSRRTGRFLLRVAGPTGGESLEPPLTTAPLRRLDLATDSPLLPVLLPAPGQARPPPRRRSGRQQVQPLPQPGQGHPSPRPNTSADRRTTARS
jgi:hypothetical protein